MTSDGTVRCGAFFRDYGVEENGTDCSDCPISLGLMFFSNHCYVHNYTDGTIGIGSARNQTTLTVTQ